MSKLRLDFKLLKKLGDKTGKSVKYLREQISRQAAKHGVRSEAYFVYWLNKENISNAVYQRSLSDNIRNEARDLLKKERPVFPQPTTTRKQRIRVIEKTFEIQNLKIKAKPDLIPQELINKAQQNTEVYPALFIFENSIRNFIQKILERRYGKKWWENKVNKHTKESVEQRMKSEIMNPWHGHRGAHEIHYADFSELAVIIRNNAVDFNPYFKRIKGKMFWLTQKLDELAMSRNNIAHVSPLRKRDRERFLLYFQDWYEQVDILNKLMK